MRAGYHTAIRARNGCDLSRPNVSLAHAAAAADAPQPARRANHEECARAEGSRSGLSSEAGVTRQTVDQGLVRNAHFLASEGHRSMLRGLGTIHPHYFL